MRQFVLTLAGVFAGLVLFFVALPMALILWAVAAAKPATPTGAQIVSLDLRQAIADQEPAGGLAFFGTRKLSVVGLVRGLDRAAKDSAVKGLFIRLPEGGLAPAAADEIRMAVRRFKESGKPVIAHSQGIYPSGQPVSTYMIGAASRRLLDAAGLLAAGDRRRGGRDLLQARIRQVRRHRRLPAALRVQERCQPFPLRRLHPGTPGVRARLDGLNLRQRDGAGRRRPQHRSHHPEGEAGGGALSSRRCAEARPDRPPGPSSGRRSRPEGQNGQG